MAEQLLRKKKTHATPPRSPASGVAPTAKRPAGKVPLGLASPPTTAKASLDLSPAGHPRNAVAAVTESLRTSKAPQATPVAVAPPSADGDDVPEGLARLLRNMARAQDAAAAAAASGSAAKKSSVARRMGEAAAAERGEATGGDDSGPGVFEV